MTIRADKQYRGGPIHGEPFRTRAFRPKPGLMKVYLTVHGGTDAFCDVMQGLVLRNARAIREGRLPPITTLTSNRLRYQRAPEWNDGLYAITAGIASAGTIASWQAAELLANDRPAYVAMVGGLPVVAVGDTVVGDLTARFGRTNTDDGPGLVGAIPDQPDEGRIMEQLLLTIDDEDALPVREFGDALALHNKRRILGQGLPPLYQSGVRYATEGIPERWYDAEEILAVGTDDCEGLAAYRAGELLADGYDAHVWTRLITDENSAQNAQSMGGGGGKRLFHALTRIDDVQGADSRGRPVKAPLYDDPSVRLGMPVPRWYRDQCRERRAQGRGLDIGT